MRAIKIAIVMILLFNGLYSMSSWMTQDEPSLESSYQLTRSLEEPAKDGLSLEGLTALVKEIRSGQELERRLNEEGGINNLDLNDDGKTDYIFVSEFGDVNRKIGYSLTVQPVKDEVQEVATVTVELNRSRGRAEIQVVGNEQIYGDSPIYNDWTEVERDVSETRRTYSGSGSYAFPLLASYFLFRPLWMSPFHYGYYPPFYSPFSIVGRGMYMNRIGRYHTTTVRPGYNSYQRSSKTRIKSPNKGRVANRGIARSLSKPTATQRAFQRTTNRNLRSGGFGRDRGASRRGATTGSRSSRLASRSVRGRSFGARTTVPRTGSSFFGGSSFRSSGGSRSFRSGK